MGTVADPAVTVPFDFFGKVVPVTVTVVPIGPLAGERATAAVAFPATAGEGARIATAATTAVASIDAIARFT
jgi:hypothetical protein